MGVMGTPVQREIMVDRGTRLCHTTMKIESLIFNFHGACFR